MGDNQNTEGRDLAEAAAFLYLKERFGVDPIYEPNGRATFPDFVVDGNVLCEATTLDVIIQKDGRAIQGRELYHPLCESLKKVLEVHAAENEFTANSSYHLECNLFPEVDQRTARSAFRAWLKIFWKAPAAIDDLKLAPGISLEVRKLAQTDQPEVSMVASPFEGGWVNQTMFQNIAHAIHSKSPKLQKTNVTYSKAILIVYGGPATRFFREDSIPLLRTELGDGGGWDEIVILMPTGMEPLSLVFADPC